MTSSPAGRRGFDPGMSGIAGYRYLMTDCVLRCGDALHDDRRYGPEVMRFRRLAAPSIKRHQKQWDSLRDGKTVNGQVEPGFWVDDLGRPLATGMTIPKSAYTGMEGALMEILHQDGIYWVQAKEKSKTGDKYRSKLKEYVDKDAEDDDADEDDEDQA